MLFAAVNESVVGTKRTSQDVCFEVRYRGQSGRQYSFRAFPLLTQLRHWPSILL